ncbi:MAG: hypothetical protein U1D55_06820 [Phycisphaerae bacterium]
MRVFTRRTLGVAAALALPATALAVPPVIDGLNIPTEFGAGALVYTQPWQTQFGDDTDNTQFGGGSELDALYIRQVGVNLYVGITGNLENNGNCMVMYFDTSPTDGQNPLFTRNTGGPIAGLPRCIAGNAGNGGLNNVTFDAGFSPNYAISISGGSPIGSQTRTYYLLNLTHFPTGADATNQILGLVTTGDPTASGPTPGTLSNFWPGSASQGVLCGVDNTNAAGVAGSSGDPLPDPNAGTAVSGLEFRIPLGLIGLSSNSNYCLFAWVSGSDGYASNQLIPAPAPSATFTFFRNIGNPDFGSPAGAFNFADDVAYPGQQFLCFTTRCVGDLNGDGRTDESDLGILLSAWQANGNGDLDGDGLTNESDLGILLADWQCAPPA